MSTVSENHIIIYMRALPCFNCILIILFLCPYDCQEYLFWRPELWCFRFLRLMPSLVKTIAAVKLWRSGKCLTRRSSSCSRRRMNLKFFNRLNFAIAFEHSSHLSGIYWWCIAKRYYQRHEGPRGWVLQEMSTALTAFTCSQQLSQLLPAISII